MWSCKELIEVEQKEGRAELTDEIVGFFASYMDVEVTENGGRSWAKTKNQGYKEQNIRSWKDDWKAVVN